MANRIIHAVVYQAVEGGPWLDGVRIGEQGYVVDPEGNTVKDIYQIQAQFSRGSFVLDFVDIEE